MNDPRLDNPVWHALAGSQARFALHRGRAARFPPDIAPFVAVEATDAADAADLQALVQVGEAVDFVGVAPRFGDAWEVAEREAVARMHLDAEVVVTPGLPIVALGSDDAPGMLALTGQVYPGYFRQRTRELGDYIGIHQDDELVAMAGERMRIGPWQEISAVCTHPDHLGRGHAQRLVATLVNAILRRGQRPFLHVSMRNVRAIRVYEHLGFATRGELGLWLARRGGG